MLLAQNNILSKPQSNQGQRVIVSTDQTQSNSTSSKYHFNSELVTYLVIAILLLLVAGYFIGLLWKRPVLTKKDSE